MKHIAHVLTFAAALAALAPAQTPQDPQQELATVIAVEEQERDLAKAEQAYRAAIAGGKLSKPALRLAEQRLGRLLKKLGRDQEADALLQNKDANAGFDDFGAAPTPQDVEREKALREKANTLVQQILADANPNEPDQDSALYGVRQSIAEQLLWIGQPAVPVVIAALENIAEVAKKGNFHPNRVAGLAGVLWRIGGPQAAEFLKGWAKHAAPPMRRHCVRTAYQANRPEMLAAVEAFLDDPEPQITFELLRNGDQDEQPLERRLDANVLLAMAERGGPEHKAFVLDWASRRNFDGPAISRRVVALLRGALASTDPEVGAAARRCLRGQVAQACLDGIELLLAETPKLGREVRLHHVGPPGDAGKKQENGHVDVSAEVARRLWPQVFARLRSLDADHPMRSWVTHVANWLMPAMGPEVVPDLLVLVEAGYVEFFNSLWYLVTPENVAEVWAHYERFGDWKARERFLLNVRVDPSASLFPRLREAAEKQRSETPGEDLAAFVWLMARTGNPEAADWITAEWQRRTDTAKWAVQPLLLLGRRTQDEKVRAAMRTLLASERLGANGGDLLLALLSMHDLPTLESKQLMGRLGTNYEHPYTEGKAPMKVADYLFGRNPQPPHGITEDELAGLLGRLAASKRIESAFSWQEFGKLTPRLHGEVVRLQLLSTPQRVPGEPVELGANSPNSVRGMLASTVLQRARTEEGRMSSLREWAATMLREPRADVREAVLAHLSKAELEPHRALVESFVDGDDETLAVCAVRKLGGTSAPLDPAKLAKNRHAGVRKLAVKQWASTGKDGGEAFLLPLLRDLDAGVRMEAAEFFGARVSKEAVPDLIALLRDPEETVRKDAADALTRIRFFHEQQAHWDRVLKGLDASSTSAVEKLLLQAKPGAPREQRLLAITSLGTLGVPEALPFLIDWTTDPDAELAAAAKASITQIHLNPKR
jgi:hypothetical protein